MYNSTVVADNVKKLAKRKGITLKVLFDECDMGRNSMSHMKEGSMPKGDTLGKLADYLDCSVDYLLGRTDKIEVNK